MKCAECGTTIGPSSPIENPVWTLVNGDEVQELCEPCIEEQVWEMVKDNEYASFTHEGCRKVVVM